MQMYLEFLVKTTQCGKWRVVDQNGVKPVTVTGHFGRLNVLVKGMDMGRMAEAMPMPKNTISMKGKAGPFDYISMGGMMTVLKVRDRLKSHDEDPGWHQHPTGTVAMKASDAEL